MRIITVYLYKPGKETTITYQGELLLEEPEHTLIHARWEHSALDLGYMVFEPGDHFYEHYYTKRWFNIFEIRSETGILKGWYCNITRPATIEHDVITSEDLELDLYVSPDRVHLLRLDQEEFDARNFATSEPLTYTAALAALDELERMIHHGEPPFNLSIEPSSSPSETDQ